MLLCVRLKAARTSFLPHQEKRRARYPGVTKAQSFRLRSFRLQNAALTLEVVRPPASQLHFEAPYVFHDAVLRVRLHEASIRYRCFFHVASPKTRETAAAAASSDVSNESCFRRGSGCSLCSSSTWMLAAVQSGKKQPPLWTLMHIAGCSVPFIDHGPKS